jgi:hypothetical protein
MAIDTLMQKIQTLLPERIAEIEDFVEFIVAREQERSLIHTAATTNTPVFNAIWNNPDDDAYDTL